jgi:hypothetical protein
MAYYADIPDVATALKHHSVSVHCIMEKIDKSIKYYPHNTSWNKRIEQLREFKV